MKGAFPNPTSPCRIACRALPQASLWISVLKSSGLGDQLEQPGSNLTWLVPTDEAIKMRLAVGELLWAKL